jgi:hypothetical protein
MFRARLEDLSALDDIDARAIVAALACRAVIVDSGARRTGNRDLVTKAEAEGEAMAKLQQYRVRFVRCMPAGKVSRWDGKRKPGRVLVDLDSPAAIWTPHFNVWRLFRLVAVVAAADGRRSGDSAQR